MRVPETHPIWCNVKHQPGADPARQFHNHHWRANDGIGTRWRAELYPTSAFGINPATVAIRLYGGVRDDFFWMWPTATDARLLGESLFELSEMALKGQA